MKKKVKRGLLGVISFLMQEIMQATFLLLTDSIAKETGNDPNTAYKVGYGVFGNQRKRESTEKQNSDNFF